MPHYQQMIEMLLKAKDLLITSHHDPDADGLGSMLGLYHMFGGADQGWTLVLEDEIAPNLRYLPGSGLLRRPADIGKKPQAVLLLDCGSTRRASRGWLNAYADLPHYCIDHHISNDFKGRLAVVEPEASSTGEIIASLCEAAGLNFNVQAATCLYAAIVSDTGCFRYQNTTPRSLEIAAALLKTGLDKEQARIQLFESRSPAAMAMLQAAFANMHYLAEGKLCYTFVRREEMQAVRATETDLHNITNYTLVRAGVKIGLFLEEYAQHVKVSLRCRQGWRVDKLAQHFDGGGHLLAAGCQVQGSLDDALPLLLAQALPLLENAPEPLAGAQKEARP